MTIISRPPRYWLSDFPLTIVGGPNISSDPTFPALPKTSADSLSRVLSALLDPVKDGLGMLA
jgi:hypothetical protein